MQASLGPADRQRALAGMAAVVFVWGSLVPVAHELLYSVDVLMIAGGRFVLGSVLLGLCTIAVERRLDLWRNVPWLRTFVLGVVGVAGFSVCLVFGVLYSGPVAASAILAAGPVVAVLVVWLVEGRRPDRRLYGPILLTVGGGILVAVGNPHAGDPGVHGGEVLLLLGMLAWSWFTSRSQAWLVPRGIDQLRLTFLTSSVAAATLMLVWVLAHDLVPQPVMAVDTMSFVWLFWLAVGPSTIGLALWNYGASRLGVTEATLIINLVPVLGVLISLAMGVPAGWLQLAGGALALSGVVWLQFRSRG